MYNIYIYIIATEVASRRPAAREGEHTEEQGGEKGRENEVRKTEIASRPTFNGEKVGELVYMCINECHTVRVS